jgi:small subunit ribosomal protein S20
MIAAGGEFSRDGILDRGHPMANTSSAKRAARHAVRRADINTSQKTRLKTEVRKVEEAIATGDVTLALAALKVAEPIIVRTGQRGIVHKKTASRKVSRLTARVRALAN